VKRTADSAPWYRSQCLSVKRSVASHDTHARAHHSLIAQPECMRIAMHDDVRLHDAHDVGGDGQAWGEMERDSRAIAWRFVEMSASRREKIVRVSFIHLPTGR
jgi:hypothetical protein